ncbi:hypothetical protein C8J56DRAFT_1161646, partial [Mycena floridula]
MNLQGDTDIYILLLAEVIFFLFHVFALSLIALTMNLRPCHDILCSLMMRLKIIWLGIVHSCKYRSNIA